MKKKRNVLPEMCYVALRATSELVIIRKGENGYYPYKDFSGSFEDAQKLAELYNAQSGLSPAQVEAMFCGSMFGWDNVAADPQSYLDRATFLTQFLQKVICIIHMEISAAQSKATYTSIMLRAKTLIIWI